MASPGTPDEGQGGGWLRGHVLLKKHLTWPARDLRRAIVTRDVAVQQRAVHQNLKTLRQRARVVRTGPLRQVSDEVLHGELMLARRLMGGIVLRRELRGGGREDTSTKIRGVQPGVEHIEDRIQLSPRMLAPEFLQHLLQRRQLPLGSP